MGIKLNDEQKAELRIRAEKLTKEVVENLFCIIDIYVRASVNKIDDLVLLFLPKVKEFVLKYVDKIGGGNDNN